LERAWRATGVIGKAGATVVARGCKRFAGMIEKLVKAIGGALNISDRGMP